MNLKNKTIGFCLTDSFCTFKNSISHIKEIKKEKANIIPIMQNDTYNLAKNSKEIRDYINEIEWLTNNKTIYMIEDAKNIGIKILLDIMIVAPCSGNILAKLSNGINDNSILIAINSHLNNSNPLVIGISTNDGLSR